MIASLGDLLERGVSNKTVLVRADLNLPLSEQGTLRDSTRIDRLLPTLTTLSKAGAKIALLSHFGRPKGERIEAMSLSKIQKFLEQKTGKKIHFAQDCIGEQAAKKIAQTQAGELCLLENTRFHKGEEANDDIFAQSLASLGDFYVNDAFSAAHRAHASTEAITKHLPSFAGNAMMAEITALQKALQNPKKPVCAIIGGAKISTKLTLIGNLLKKMDSLVIGGAMANSFLAAQGGNIGKSLCEHDMLDMARSIITEAKNQQCTIILPHDVVVASELAQNSPAENIPIDAIADDKMILDIGEKTTQTILQLIEQSHTLLWNGPVGVFETPPFDKATNQIAQKILEQTQKGSLLSLAGGGDTLAALKHAGIGEGLSYISTAGGAFLEWLEGKALPGITALEQA